MKRSSQIIVFKSLYVLIVPLILAQPAFSSTEPNDLFLSCPVKEYSWKGDAYYYTEASILNFKIEGSGEKIYMFDDSNFQYKLLCRSKDDELHKQKSGKCFSSNDYFMSSSTNDFGFINTEKLDFKIARTTGHIFVQKKIYSGKIKDESDIMKVLEFFSQKPLIDNMISGECRRGSDQSDRKRAF